MTGKISIAQQIEEVDYELDQRKDVYGRMDARGVPGKSAREFHVTRMRAVKSTLEWLRDNEERIKAKAEGACVTQAPSVTIEQIAFALCCGQDHCNAAEHCAEHEMSPDGYAERVGCLTPEIVRQVTAVATVLGLPGYGPAGKKV